MRGALTVLAGANGWHEERFADRQLGEALADRGPVLFVDPPTTRAQRRRAPSPLGSGLVRYGDTLWHLRVRTLPGAERAGVARYTGMQMRRAIRNATRSIALPVAATIGTSVLHSVFDDASASVFWYQDDVVGGASLMGVRASRNAIGEARMFDRADVVVAANPLLAERAHDQGMRTEFIPFGCNVERFTHAAACSTPQDVRVATPYAMYMGLIGPRTDMGLLREIARAGVPLLVCGPPHDDATRRDLEDLQSSTHVQWVGERSPSQLAAYLSAAAVGIVPYAHNPFNVGSFPLKTLEYLAAGVPVVATDLPATRWLASESVTVASDGRAFVHAVQERARRRSTYAQRREMQLLAQQHSWTARAAAWDTVVQRAYERHQELLCA
jgi:teichuronic acid biosynthesis glycosyltransferase TuaH